MSEWIEGATVFRVESGEPVTIKKVYKNGNFILDEEHLQQYRPGGVGESAWETGNSWRYRGVILGTPENTAKAERVRFRLTQHKVRKWLVRHLDKMDINDPIPDESYAEILKLYRVLKPKPPAPTAM